MRVLETARLSLRELVPEDAEFILELVNEPSWIRFIGDKGIRTLDAARNYITTGPVASYRRYGFGLYLVALKETGASTGICGLIKRDTLEHADIGFAFLPRYWGHGYAYESAAAVLEHGFRVVGQQRILAITNQDNQPSIALLEKLGMKFQELVQMSDKEPPLKLFAADSTASQGH